jgi:circadian clock protein KaiC
VNLRRQLLALKHDLARRGCTILLLENVVVPGTDPLLQSLVHGIVALEQLSPPYGAERRRVRVAKLREVSFRGGFHDFRTAAGLRGRARRHRPHAEAPRGASARGVLDSGLAFLRKVASRARTPARDAC